MHQRLRCKTFVRAYKQLTLWRLPDILVVHLKRFRYSRYRRDRIGTLIDSPISGLDMKPFLPDVPDHLLKHGTVYDLYAVSNHSGGLGGGHYTAAAKNPETGKWYYFNDSSVGSTSQVISSGNYVLFYQRRK